MPRPRPTPSELTAPFWAAAREHRLVRPRCNACGNSFFTPQVACPSCLSENWDYAESVGSGTVYSFTVVHRPPSLDFAAPYVLAVVDLADEGWSMLTNVVDCDPSSVRADLSVQVAWDDGRDFTYPVFRPVA